MAHRDAANTGLPQYIRGAQPVYAAKITAILPLPEGHARLYFGELDKIANVRSEWFARHNPQVGGYFAVAQVSDEELDCRFVDANSFETECVRVD